MRKHVSRHLDRMSLRQKARFIHQLEVQLHENENYPREYEAFWAQDMKRLYHHLTGHEFMSCTD